MIPQTKTRTLETHGHSHINTAQIACTAEIFSLLSGSIYSQPERAVVRELLTNAIDSHIEAGTTDRPIKVHIPTELEPWFSVADQGLGLTPEQFESVFCGYGFSSKHHSNDLAGAFGIGAKSPFAVTDQFTVTSTKDGTEYQFALFLQDNGLPGNTELARRKTDKPNGLTVTVPVKMRFDAASQFQNPLRDMLPHIDVPIETNYPTTAEPLVPLFENKHGAVIEKGLYDSVVLMGPVRYQFAPRDLFDTTEYYDLPEATRHVLRQNLMIYGQIGEFDISASREKLNMTERTRKALRAKLEALVNETIAHLTKQLDQAETVYDFMGAYEVLRIPGATERSKFAPLFHPTHHAWLCFDKAASLSPRHVHVRQIYERSRDRKEGFTPYTSNPNYSELRNLAVLAAPKSWGMKQAVANHFAQNPEVELILVLRAELDEARAWIQELGIPVEVSEMPKPQATGQRPKKFGKTQYRMRIIDLDGSSNSVEGTLDELLVDLDLSGMQLLIHDVGDVPVTQLQHCIKNRLVTLNKPMIAVSIPENHNKVREEFEVEALKTGGCSIKDLQGGITVNVTRARRLRFLASTRTEIDFRTDRVIEYLAEAGALGPDALRLLSRARRSFHDQEYQINDLRLVAGYEATRAIVTEYFDNAPQNCMHQRCAQVEALLDPLRAIPGIAPLIKSLYDYHDPRIIESITAQLENL